MDPLQPQDFDHTLKDKPIQKPCHSQLNFHLAHFTIAPYRKHYPIQTKHPRRCPCSVTNFCMNPRVTNVRQACRPTFPLNQFTRPHKHHQPSTKHTHIQQDASPSCCGFIHSQGLQLRSNSIAKWRRCRFERGN